MQELNRKLLKEFNGAPSAESSKIRQVELQLPFKPPASYVQFLLYANGGEGFVGEQYIILWRAEELLELNEAYEVRDYAPGLFLFGSDGGGEAFAFDLRIDPYPIVSVPFVGMDVSLAETIASSFDDFFEQLSKS